MKIFIFSSFISMFLVISGCSSNTELADIEDWEAFGESSGLQGKPLLSPDMIGPDAYREYELGYQAGVSIYCQKDAYLLGIRGETYHRVCDEINPEFATNYAMGFYDMRMNDLRSENDNSLSNNGPY